MTLSLALREAKEQDRGICRGLFEIADSSM